MLITPDPKQYTKADIRDLNNDPIIRWQHKNYLFIGPFMAFVVPTLVAGIFWGDYLGGYFCQFNAHNKAGHWKHTSCEIDR